MCCSIYASELANLDLCVRMVGLLPFANPEVRSPNPQNVSLWQSHIDAQAVSGLSIATYCKEQQVSAQSFYQWKRKLQTEDSKQNESSTLQSTAAPSVTTSFVQLLLSRPIHEQKADQGISEIVEKWKSKN